MRDLARRLLAANRPPSGGQQGKRDGEQVHEAIAVCESLRIGVTRFAGPDGFAALLRRALVLARAEAPLLKGVRLGANNQLEGLEQLARDEEGAEAAVALAAHVLTLLVTFIGESLTMRLVRENWPDAKLDT